MLLPWLGKDCLQDAHSLLISLFLPNNNLPKHQNLNIERLKIFCLRICSLVFAVVVILKKNKNVVCRRRQLKFVFKNIFESTNFWPKNVEIFWPKKFSPKLFENDQICKWKKCHYLGLCCSSCWPFWPLRPLPI